jgi:hypothetical protein
LGKRRKSEKKVKNEEKDKMGKVKSFAFPFLLLIHFSLERKSPFLGVGKSEKKVKKL